MSKIRKLENPPIKEAVIEFQFQPLIDFEKDDLIEIYKNVNEHYNEQKFIEQQDVSFHIQPDLPTQINDEIHQILGTILRDEKRGFVVQFKRERLSVSKLKPYTNFEEVETEAFSFYKIIEKYLINKNISRIAVRFINEINYLKDYTKIFEKEPLNYFQQSIHGIKRIYNQDIYEHSDTENSIINYIIDFKSKQIIIDIDSYSLKLQNSNDIGKIKEVLATLRQKKNSIFFQIVSKKLEESL